jgi:hypothetical protein
MPRRYRHSELGESHKLNLSPGNISTSIVWDASFAGLVHYLNACEKGGEPGSILKILRLMLELETLEPPVWNEQIEGPMIVERNGRHVPNPVLRKLSPAKYQRQQEISEKQDLINRELATYHFSPRIFCLNSNSEAKWWSVTWRVRSKVPKKAMVRKGIVQMDDGRALRLILDLARAGYVNRLRKCLCCNKWLYARYRHQDYCSTKCQQEHYRKSDEWKRKRRDYMRTYRQLDR